MSYQKLNRLTWMPPKNSNDLQLFFHVTNLFHKNQEDKVYLFTGWFIFVLAEESRYVPKHIEIVVRGILAHFGRDDRDISSR